MSRRRARSGSFFRVSRRQLAGLGVVGVIGLVGAANGVLDLAEKLARLAHGSTPSGKPVSDKPAPGPYVR